MNCDEKIIIARAEDLYMLCEKYAEPKFSGFLNESEQTLIKEHVGSRIGFDTIFSGGYDDSERCMLGIFPEWTEERRFPITLLRAEKGYERRLTHRDYLGSILSLGLERSKVGDILVDDDGAYIFCSDDIADYICFNIKKIASCGVKLSKADINSAKLAQHEFKIVSAVAASDRLDAILAAALGISRRESALLINSGKTFVNHREAVNVSASVKEKDLISVRGFGRVILESYGSITGSGRIHVSFKKYK